MVNLSVTLESDFQVFQADLFPLPLKWDKVKAQKKHLIFVFTKFQADRVNVISTKDGSLHQVCDTSLCQISSKSVSLSQRYCDFSIFKNGQCSHFGFCNLAHVNNRSGAKFTDIILRFILRHVLILC